MSEARKLSSRWLVDARLRRVLGSNSRRVLWRAVGVRGGVCTPLGGVAGDDGGSNCSLPSMCASIGRPQLLELIRYLDAAAGTTSYRANRLGVRALRGACLRPRTDEPGVRGVELEVTGCSRQGHNGRPGGVRASALGPASWRRQWRAACYLTSLAARRRPRWAL